MGNQTREVLPSLLSCAHTKPNLSGGVGMQPSQTRSYLRRKPKARCDAKRHLWSHSTSYDNQPSSLAAMKASPPANEERGAIDPLSAASETTEHSGSRWVSLRCGERTASPHVINLGRMAMRMEQPWQPVTRGEMEENWESDCMDCHTLRGVMC